jgi:GAF domain-containing protein
VGRFGGMLLRGSGQTSWQAKGGLQPRGRVASARLAELVQLTLVADAAIVDLRPYAERQRATGAAEHLETAGILLSGGEAETSEVLLWRMADPIEASANGFQSYAGVPFHDNDGALLGRIVAMQRGQRVFDGHDLKILRTVADIVADMIRQPQLAS